ncbi:hypothetical protein O181_014410 [Austropuccinia psidii MF-1]|uniref:Tet-like 2OG-Fe(II) oxygenase domain-containing protein n=1 Tax=Austropuccinia psidii MF-1 TaxID=1389203 RepID=A0A9Q3C0X0_9BASI|nr:hypothetical protein [Austropuccinia psidii MF-1]
MGALREVGFITSPEPIICQMALCLSRGLGYLGIRTALRYSTWWDWKLIEWEHQYIKLNNALSTAIFRFGYLRSPICKRQHAIQEKRKGALKGTRGKCAHWAPWKNIGFSRFRLSQCHVASNREVKECVPNKDPWALGTILDSKGLRPFTTMSEVEVNQWDELSQFLFCKRRFTELIATNGALIEGFMFTIGWRKCSTKNENFGLYGSLGKIENAKDEWWNRVANLSLINYEANIPSDEDAFEFASALTFTMKGFKNSPHLDKDASLYSLGWWFQADKRTRQIQRYASKRCTGGKLIFPNENFMVSFR